MTTSTMARRACRLFVTATLLCAACTVHAEVTAPTEHQVKAAFLYNFAKFVEWPAEALGDELIPFNLCVLGAEPFATAREYLAGKTVKGRKLEVRHVATTGDVRGCHMLFMSAEEAPDPAVYLAAGDSRVLKVGEAGDFIRRGGIINLVRAENKFRFEINRGAGERAGFKFSSQLLKLANIVGEDH